MTDDLHTDGNDIAGLLDEVFGADITTATPPLPRRAAASTRSPRTAPTRAPAVGAALPGAAPTSRCAIGDVEEQVVFEWRGTISAAARG